MSCDDARALLGRSRGACAERAAARPRRRRFAEPQTALRSDRRGGACRAGTEFARARRHGTPPANTAARPIGAEFESLATTRRPSCNAARQADSSGVRSRSSDDEVACAWPVASRQRRLASVPRRPRMGRLRSETPGERSAMRRPIDSRSGERAIERRAARAVRRRSVEEGEWPRARGHAIVRCGSGAA